MRKLSITLLLLSLSGVSCGILPGRGHHDGEGGHHGHHEPAVSAEEGATMLGDEHQRKHFGNVQRWSSLMRDRD